MVAALVCCALVASPSTADATDVEVGGIGGVGYNLLTQPNDPAGEYTFLWGSAFTGMAAISGGSVVADVASVQRSSIAVGADVLYGHHRGTGYAREDDGRRIDVVLSANVVRVPLMVRLRGPADEASLTVGAGVEPIIGLTSSADYEYTDIDGQIQEVDTTSRLSASVLVALGVELPADDGLVVPMEARLGWNPFVGSSSQQRFDDFQSPERPGAFRVEFDWQLMLTTGVRWGL